MPGEAAADVLLACRVEVAITGAFINKGKKTTPKGILTQGRGNCGDQRAATPPGHLNNHYPQSSAVRVICTQPPP